MYDVVIIGGGPAGASAATFVGRAGLRVAVIDADKGITRRAELNNHLGFPHGISGPELVDRGREQAVAAGADWLEGTAESLTGEDGALTVGTGEGGAIEGRQVILATGVSVALAESAGIPTVPGTEPRIPKIVVVDGEGRTSMAGVWAAGTVAGTSVHTIITAGDGARVAINLISAVRGERYVDHDVLPAPTS